MAKSKTIARIIRGCVACGCCVKACPRGALSIDRGLRAVVNAVHCVGCGKCAEACPAGVVELTARKEESREQGEKAVV